MNFWQPSGGRAFRVISPGEPFFFKLKKPHYAIAGFGVFARSSILPVSLAWEAFAEKNGAPDFRTMRLRIERLRHTVPDRHVEYTIGCLMVAEPVFFDPNEWIPQPNDWGTQTVQGAGYDLTFGEGRRIWEECEARAASKQARTALVSHETENRYGSPVLVRPRLGQGIFRVAVTDAYGRACALTGEHSLPALEAAHIRPYSEGGPTKLGTGYFYDRTSIDSSTAGT